MVHEQVKKAELNYSDTIELGGAGVRVRINLSRENFMV